ncbi:MAG: ABC transporter ATP-binding protein [Acetobacterales bacterium]
MLDISRLTVDAGERVFIRGPSGSGKTTLLNLLSGVAVPESGTLEVMGTGIGALSGSARDAFRADHVGFIFQMFNLVPYLSPVENVALACRFSKLRRARAIQRSGSVEGEALRLLEYMGLGADTVAGHSSAQLSIGQQQRVAAARALIGAPELVIADEPTSALDDDMRETFLGLLFGEVSVTGATLLFVSHDARLRGRFDRAVDLPEINRTVPEA